MAKFMDVIKLARKLTPEEEQSLVDLGKYLNKHDITLIKRLVKQKKIEIAKKEIKSLEQTIPIIKIIDHSGEKALKENIDEINDIITEKIKKKSEGKFSKQAFEKIPQLIAPKIVGFDTVKQAVALQMFAPDHIHILLLGDPGTGKTDIIRSASEFYETSSFGLGSGTSGAGLAVTVKGKEVQKGLLPMADQGLCAIDELNLMKDESKASLYNAMEKGFITYDKGGHHYKFDSRVSVIATANPKGDKFTAKEIDGLKKQMPFDAALLSRFHLVFFIRKPDIEKFAHITKSIIRGEKKKTSKEEIDFVKSYLIEANKIDKITIPSKFEKQIVDFVADIKRNEERYLVEVSPRLVIGFMRLAKASARMEKRTEIQQIDINRVKEIIQHGLKLDI
ncbi:ATP-binding protein [Nanoarchaeota archaeon]